MEGKNKDVQEDDNTSNNIGNVDAEENLDGDGSPMVSSSRRFVLAIDAISFRYEDRN